LQPYNSNLRTREILAEACLSCQQEERKERATEMARGNQRDKAREKNLKEQAGKVTSHLPQPNAHSQLHPPYPYAL
jgi:hypothetical protein